MDRMVIPHQYNRPANTPQQPSEKGDHLFATQRAAMRTDRQLQLAASWRNQQRAEQVQPLMMIQTGSHTGGLSTRRPGTLERRNQRKTAFIFSCQRRVQFTPLFLSAARCSDASAPLLARPDRTDVAGAVGNSSLCAAEYARRHSDGSAHQTAARSDEPSGRASSSPRHSRGRKHHASVPFPAAATVWQSIGWAVQARAWPWASGSRLLAATGARHGPSLQAVQLFPLLACWPAEVSSPACDGLPTVQMSLLISCVKLWHMSGLSLFKTQ